MDIRTALLEAMQFVKSGGDRSKLEGYLAMTDSLVGILKNALYREAHEFRVSTANHCEVIRESIKIMIMYALITNTC